MTLLAPWALLGLVALPIIWWVQRRRRQAAGVELPTLMFLLEEDERVHQPQKRQLDLETLLALLGAGLLALAAAGPVVSHGTAVKHVRVIVAGGAPAEARGYRARVAQILAQVRRTGALLDAMEVPAPGPGTARAPRPSLDALLGAARAGKASVRMVIADRVPEALPGDVRWVASGDPEAANTGVVAATIRDRQLFLTLLHDAPVAAEVGVRWTAADGAHDLPRLSLAPGAVHALTIPLPERGTREVGVALTGPPDALRADDTVTIRLHPLGVHIDGPSDAPTARALRRALLAVVGPEALGLGRDLRIGIGSGSTGDLLVGARAPQAATVRAPPGDLLRIADPIVADLDPAGIEFMYTSGDEQLAPGEIVLLGVRAPDRTWPIVTRRADGTIRFAPDPVRGAPAPADAPLWPLFIENVVRARGSFGMHADGLLDPDSSTLGRDVRAFDPTWVTAARADQPAPRTRLRTPLLVAALLGLCVLWSLPRLRRGASSVSEVPAAI